MEVRSARLVGGAFGDAPFLLYVCIDLGESGYLGVMIVRFELGGGFELCDVVKWMESLILS